MKTSTAGVPVEFKPVTVTITLETQDEVDAFYNAGGNLYSNNHSGSIIEKLGESMRDAVEQWARNVQ